MGTRLKESTDFEKCWSTHSLLCERNNMVAFYFIIKINLRVYTYFLFDEK